ncbi:MAG TPA: C1 family peptidase [Lacunisphaera sp.]|nr:C1 family peptidase [Lacunisphaera sp.]
MKRLPGILAFLVLLPLARGEVAYGPGTKIDTLTAGGATYQHVVVRSVNARTVMFIHDGGMASVHLRDLPPEWQARFHYDAAADAAADAALRVASAATVPPPPPPRRTVALAAAKPGSAFDALMQSFGQPAEVLEKVDLRQSFFDFGLWVKDQGHRPSCAVFAIVSALEFQNAEVSGRAQKFSEEYLLWASRKMARRLPAPGAFEAAPDDYDEGFSLSEVVDALRGYGIPLQATMPNTFGTRIDAIEDPSDDIVREARAHKRVFLHALPGRDGPTRVNNLILALNAGLPVPVGMLWPNVYLPHGYISTQKPTPNAGHAVTIVGYLCSTRKLNDTTFIFKNSWGPRWGQGGYGTVSYAYLVDNLTDGVLLELAPTKG